MVIIPAPSDLTRPYWEEARRGRLVTQHCGECARIWHPPLPRCPHCHGTSLGWRPVSGDGTVYSFTIVQHATHVALSDQVPYVVALIELAEGPRIVAGIRGAAPGRVRVGMAVRVIFEDVTEQVSLPQFTPVPGTEPDERGHGPSH